MARIDLFEIPQAKVEDYLLNIDHPEGGSKAKFFLGRGFHRARPEVLANALANQTMIGWPGHELPAPASVKHRIVGPIECPDGSVPNILTVWQVQAGSATASFVTARPHRPKVSGK